MANRHGGYRPGSGRKPSPRGPRPAHKYCAYPDERAAAVLAIQDQTSLGTVGELIRALAIDRVRLIPADGDE